MLATFGKSDQDRPHRAASVRARASSIAIMTGMRLRWFTTISSVRIFLLNSHRERYSGKISANPMASAMSSPVHAVAFQSSTRSSRLRSSFWKTAENSPPWLCRRIGLPLKRRATLYPFRESPVTSRVNPSVPGAVAEAASHRLLQR